MSNPVEFTEAEIQLMLDNLDAYSPEEQAEIDKIADVLARRHTANTCQNDLIAFCKHMQPDYKVGKHHRVLADLLMQIADGEKDRVCVNIPPRHGKSHLVSTYFPAWFIGKYPDKKVLMVSHTTDLAVDFGRKVRNIIDSERFKDVFPDILLAADSKSAGRWSTNKGGEYFACGVGSALAGRGADLLLVDDPHNEQDVINGNFGVFEKAYEWFTYGARTRLMPGGRVAIVQCMTGDTPVLMADGVEKPLANVRPGDMVATYANGVLDTSEVLNHRSNGVDRVFTIKTTCGIVVKANERHPFLTTTDGELRWTRLKHLKVGDTVVSLKGARALQGQKPSRVSAPRASQQTPTTEKTPLRPAKGLGIGVNTWAKFVRLINATTLLAPKGFAYHTITKSSGNSGARSVAPKVIARRTSSIATESRLTNTAGCLPSRVGFAPSASSLRQSKIPAPIGAISCALTTATAAIRSARSFVTTVILPWVTQKQQKLHLPWRSTCEFTTTKIASIEYVGQEEVFDVQIDKTENFIANRLVSHNTRWHQDDLTGRVTRDMSQNAQSDQYEIVEFPAIMEVPDPDDPDAIVEKPLWPEFFDLEALHRTKASMPTFQWNAQFQQNPTAEEASIVKRDWWNIWTKEDPPVCQYIIVTLDAAAETHNRADYTALTTWGVFMNEERDGPGANTYNIILLDAIKARMEFPELKDAAMRAFKEWKPDAFIVEKKSSGTALYQELRRTGLAVSEYTPHRGSGDKMARLNSVADIVRSGICWVPQTRWAEELVEEIAGFPFMANDDLVDTTTMALMRFRQGGFVRLPTDEADDIRYFKSRSGGSKYY